jgi:hypothetical protein
MLTNRNRWPARGSLLTSPLVVPYSLAAAPPLSEDPQTGRNPREFVSQLGRPAGTSEGIYRPVLQPVSVTFGAKAFFARRV